MNYMDRRNCIINWFKGLQQSIIQDLEKEDARGKFSFENWERPGGGGGITCLMVDGGVIEKGGVNFSAVEGNTPDSIKKLFKTEADSFFASGVSIVIHPLNPFVPIIHMNVRYFELSDGTAWFGGGIDLTPVYVFDEDARFFHSMLKATCDRFDSKYYLEYKIHADDYFFIRHRNEMRGIGGIFYDRLDARSTASFDHFWAFTQAVGETFAPVYLAIVRKRKAMKWTEQNKWWQLHRRSRYVEFNLVYDSGTRFGLETNGRTESILMSMPPLARWETNYEPLSGSEEARSNALFQKGIEWI